MLVVSFRKFLKAVSLVSACVYTASFNTKLYAQELNYKFKDEVVVTGTRTPKANADAPVKTEIVGSEEIEENHFKSVDEALPILPGVLLQQNGRRPGSSAVIQGLGEDHVLVLVDGIPQLQSSSYGFDLSQVSTAMVKRVEVIKGGSSALYGSQAMGGVINIITKKPTDQTQYLLDLETGAYGEDKDATKKSLPYGAQAMVSGKLGKPRYRLNVSQREQAAFDRDKNSIAEDIGKFRKTDASLYLTQALTDQLSLYGQYRIFDESLETTSSVPSPSLGVEARRNETAFNSHGFTLGFDNKFTETNRLNAYAFYEITDDRLILGDNPTTPFVETQKDSLQRNFRTEVQLDHLFAERHLVTLGYVYSQSFLNQENLTTTAANTSTEQIEVDEKKHSANEIYVQDDIMFTEWEFVPGLRVDSDSSFGTHLSPKLSVKYSPALFASTVSNFRASVGGGYRVPTLKERYYVLDHRAFAGYIVKGNTELEPETSLSYQLGAEFLIDKKTEIYLNAFLNEIDDLISPELIQDGSTTTTYLYQNIEAVQSRGLEFKFASNPLHWLNTDLTYTYSETRDKNTNTIVPFRPFSVIRASLRFFPEPKKLSFLTIANYRSNEYVDLANTTKSPSYVTLDAKLNYELFQSTTLYLGVDNFLNEVRRPLSDDLTQDFDNRPLTGRFYYLGFQIKG